MARGMFICIDHYGGVSLHQTVHHADPESPPDLTDILSTLRPAELASRIFFIRAGSGEVWLMKDRYWDHRRDGARLPLILTSSLRQQETLSAMAAIERPTNITVYRTKAEPEPEQPFRWWIVKNIFHKHNQGFIRVLARTGGAAEAEGTRQGFEMPFASLLGAV